MAPSRISLERLKEGAGYRPDFSRGAFYLDRGTGEVEYLNDPEADDARRKGADIVAIEPVSEREELGWMEQFAEARRGAGRVDEWRQLKGALFGAKPVERFNAVLSIRQEARGAWLQERERRLTAVALRWLDSLGLEYELE